MIIIEKDTLGEAYKELIETLLDVKSQDSVTKELLNCSLVINRPSSKDLIFPYRTISSAYAKAELEWYWKGSNSCEEIGKHSDVEWLNNAATKIDKSAVFTAMNDIITNISVKHSGSKYVANLMLYRYTDCMYHKFRREAYSDYKQANLPGMRNALRVPIGYEEILCDWYGFNWKVPTKEANGHSGVYYNANEPYTKYAGISKRAFEALTHN